MVYSPLNLSRVRYGDQFGHVRYAFEENELIDRVVGLPGDHVVWDAGKLVDQRRGGALETTDPRAVAGSPRIDGPEGSLSDPADHFGASHRGGRVGCRSGGFRHDPPGDILGRAYLRLSPLSRLWLIR